MVSSFSMAGSLTWQAVWHGRQFDMAGGLTWYLLLNTKCLVNFLFLRMCGWWLVREGSFVTYHGRGSQCLRHSVTLPSTIHDSSSLHLFLPTPLQAWCRLDTSCCLVYMYIHSGCVCPCGKPAPFVCSSPLTFPTPLQAWCHLAPSCCVVTCKIQIHTFN